MQRKINKVDYWLVLQLVFHKTLKCVLKSLVNAGVDVIVIDTAHGHSKGVSRCSYADIREAVSRFRYYRW